MTSEENEEIYSLMIPLVGRHLLIPRSNVVEVSSVKPLSSYNGAVPWLLGSMEWKDSLVPVVSFEGACGDAVPEVKSGSRIVMFRCLTSALDASTFGVISQGFPQLVRVSEDVLQLETASFSPQVPVLCQVSMANQSPRIPDIEKLEQLIADAIALSVN